MNAIKICKVSIDDVIVEGNPCLRGVIDPASLAHLQIDKAYQREYLASATRRYIMDALAKQQRLPDLELGMRGQTWQFAGNDVLLMDPVYIIDGQQRRGSILEFRTRFPDIDPRQGVVVHFGSTPAWERQRFQALNLHQTRVSTSIIARNLRDDCRGIASVYGLTQTERNFPLYERVGWGQSLGANHLISGTGYVTAALSLHAHMGGGVGTIGIRGAATAFDKLEGLIGLAQLRANVKTFWEVVDGCWGVKELSKRGATYLKTTFIQALTDVFSDHVDFWSGDNSSNFVVPSEIRHRLEHFPVSDPEIRNLSGSAGQARTVLGYNFISWIDKGRRNILRKRNLEELLSRHKSEASRARHRRRNGDGAADGLFAADE